MKNIFSLLVFVLLSTGLSAQKSMDKNYYLVTNFNIDELTNTDQHIVDSCLNIFHYSKKDIPRIKALAHICDNIMDNSWTQFQVYNYNFIKSKLDNSSDHESKEIIVEYLIDALNNLSIMEVDLGNKQNAIDYCKEGVKLSTESSYEYGRAKSYSGMGYVYLKFGELESSLAYLKKSNIIFRSLNNEGELIANQFNIAEINESLGDTKNAIKSYEICLTYYKKTKNKRIYAICNNSIALIHTKTGNFEEALKILSETSQIFKEIGDISSLSTAYTNIGDIYAVQGELDTALKEYNKGLSITRKFKSKLGEAHCLNSIANIYYRKRDFDNALKYYNASLEIELEIQNNVGVARCYQNLGALYEQKGELSKAMTFSLKGLEIYESLNFDQEIAHSQVNVANLLFKTKKFSEAKKYAKKGFNIAYERGYPSIIQTSARLLYSIAENEGDYKTAFQMHVLYTKMKDSLINLDNKALVIRDQIENEHRLKTDELKNQALTKSVKLEKQKIRIKEQNYITALLILLIIAIVLLVLWRRSIYKLKIKWLEEDIFKSQMKPHFLYNVLVSIQSLIVQKRNNDAIEYLSEIALFMRSNLNLISTKKINIEEEIHLATQYLDLEKLRFKDKLEFEVINKIVSSTPFTLPPLILQPIIENSIIHGFKKIDSIGKVNITCSAENGYLQILIEDNGIGLNQNKKENSKGLKIVKKRLSLANSKNKLIIEQRTPEKGVRVTLTIHP